MATNLFKSINFIRCVSGASLNLFRYAAMVLVLLLGVGNAWAGGGSTTTYTSKLTVTGGATGEGYVYGAKSSSATVEYQTSVTTEETSNTSAESDDTYYAWAMPVRGNEFNSWTKSSIKSLAGSANPYTVKVTSSSSTTTGTLTATWTTYTKVNVTYNPSEDGAYSVTYRYNSYNSGNKTITNGDAEGLSRTITPANGVQTIGSYHNDVITLESTSGELQGWYSDASFNTPLSGITNNGDGTYTFVAPESGSVSIYAKYPHVDKYYGRLTASIAAVPYSMPGGGMIFVSETEGFIGDYSDAEQVISNTSFGSTSQTYYLHAKTNDKRYVFRGWYSNPECTGAALSTNADYAYTFTATSMNSASPTTGNVYAAFDFNLYYMQVEVEPAVPGLGMVLVKDNNTGTPDYTAYASHAEQFLYAYRLAPTANAYLYAKPKYGYKFSGWYDNPDCTGSVKSTANPYTYVATGTSTNPLNPDTIRLYAKFVEDASKVNITYNIPDKTKGEYTASVLDIAEIDDEFVWTFTEVYNSADYTANTTLSQNKTDVLQLEAQPQAGYGVTSWTEGSTPKTTPSQIYETTGTAAKTLSVAFGEARPFLVGAANANTGTAYSTLREALDNLGSNTKITVVQNAYVPAGTYTIPSGVTLLVPYDNTYTVHTNEPTKSSGTTAPSPYCMLTLASGVHISVQGAISVDAIIRDQQNSNTAPTGKCGMVTMEKGSQIELQSGANLYVWGCVLGEGDITAHSGSTVYEALQANDYPGGTFLSLQNSTLKSKKIFPIRIYCFPNIQAYLHIESGAQEKLSAAFASMNAVHNIAFIGSSSGLFRLNSGSTLTKWYDKANDRQRFSVEGNASIESMSLNVGISVNTGDYLMPLTHNMQIEVLSGTTTVKNDLELLPGAQVLVAKDATISINSGASLYVYDKDEWNINHTFANGVNKSIIYGRTKTMSYAKADLDDSKMDVRGAVIVNGALYSTSTGGNITGSEGGTITVNALGSKTTINQVYEKGSTSQEYHTVNVSAAKLHNGDNSYVATAGSSSGDKYIYSEEQERWLKNPMTVTWNANSGMCDVKSNVFSQEAFLGVLPVAYKDGYTLAGWFTAADGGSQISETTKVTANATYYAHWTPKSYSITYRDNGGTAFSGTHIDSPNPHPTAHTFNTATPLNGVVNNKTGYTFGGWYRTPSCSGAQVTTIAATECKNITLYAKWSPEEYTITYKDKGNVAFSGVHGDGCPTKHTYGTATTLVDPTKENYIFDGWYTSSDCSTGKVTSLGATDYSAGITLYAKWTAAVATVMVNDVTTPYSTLQTAITAANGKTDATVKMLQSVEITAQIDLTAAMTIDLNGKKISSTQTTANTAVFKINASGKTVTIKDSGTNGEINHTASVSGYMYGLNLYAGSLNIESGTIYAKNNAANRAYGIYTEGTASSITISGSAVVKAESSTSPFGIYSSKEGCTLTMNGGTFIANGAGSRGIYMKGNTNLTDATITVTGSSKAYAIFAVSGNMTINSGTYTTSGASDNLCIFHRNNAITINGGYFSTPNKLYQRDSGTSYTGTITLQGGYYNKDTELEVKCATNFHVLPNADANYPYKVAEAYTVTFNNYDGTQLQTGYVEKNVSPAYDGAPTKPSSAQYDYIFTGWDPAIVPVTANVTYTAQFSSTSRTYAVTMHTNEGTINAGNVTSYTYGVGATLPTNVSRTGYEFGGWYDNSGLTGDAVTTISTTATGDKEYWAKWTVNTYTITWLNWNGDDLDNETIKSSTQYGGQPGYPTGRPDPSRASANGRTYAWDGWMTGINGAGTFYAKDALPNVIGNTTYYAHFCITDIVVSSNETIEEKMNVGTTTVRIAGKLTVTSDTLKTTDLILEGTPTSSGQITGKGTVTATRALFHFSQPGGFKAKTWYAVAVPWKVDVPAYRLGGVYLKKGSGAYVQQTLGSTYDLIYYNGELRATGANKAWNYVEEDQLEHDTHYEMKPGVAYMIYLATDADTIRFERAATAALLTTETVAHTYDSSIDDTYANWNGIANPATYHAYLNVGATENIGQVYVAETQQYKQFNMKDSMLVVGQPIFVQSTVNDTVIANSMSYSPSLAPRRSKAWTAPFTRYELMLAADDADVTDRVIVRLDEEKEEDAYIVGQDLVKMGVSSIVPQMWINRYDSKMCINTVAGFEHTADYPLGIFAPKDGDYDLFIDDQPNDETMLYLTYDGEAIWNLSYGGYVTYLTKGTDTHYGLRIVARKPQITTGIEETTIQNGDPIRKVMVGGKVYIIRNGEIYSVTGQKTK